MLRICLRRAVIRNFRRGSVSASPIHPSTRHSRNQTAKLIDFKILSSAAQTQALIIAAPDVLPQEMTGRYDKSPDHDGASRDSEGVRKSLVGAVVPLSERRCS